MSNNKQSSIDTHLGKYKWYRRLIGGYWYKHQFTRDVQDICVTFVGVWWARYGEINRYSMVVEQEIYEQQ